MLGKDLYYAYDPMTKIGSLGTTKDEALRRAITVLWSYLKDFMRRKNEENIIELNRLSDGTDSEHSDSRSD